MSKYRSITNWWFKMVGENEKEGLEINGLWVAIALEMELVMGHQPLPQGQSSGRLQIPKFLLVFGNAVCLQLTGYLQLHYGVPYLCGPWVPLEDTGLPKNFQNISSIIFPHSSKTDLSVPSLLFTPQPKWVNEVNLRPQVNIVSLENTSSPRSVPRQWWLIVLSTEQN